MINIDFVFSVVSWISIILGCFLILTGSIGFFRFRDFWSRLHAASVTDSGGMLLLILGMCLQSGFTLVTVKLIFMAIFLLITGPTATHAIANAAFVSGLMPNGDQGKTGYETYDKKIDNVRADR
tara:strand:+ start:762 stop:1133 length:372 start_codon:yes stop_codon:yes gene_type:complete